MKNRLLVSLSFLLFAFSIVSCDNKTLNTANAVNAVANYMEEKPIYESTTFNIGEVKLRVSKDDVYIKNLKNLEKDGYINLEEVLTKKKWLSKDSIYTATIKLTDSSRPYILEQKGNKIQIKTIEYKLDKKSGIQLDNKNNKSANASVMLEKQLTPFAFLKEDSSPHTDFITRKFKLKYTEEAGWKVTK